MSRACEWTCNDASKACDVIHVSDVTMQDCHCCLRFKHFYGQIISNKNCFIGAVQNKNRLI